MLDNIDNQRLHERIAEVAPLLPGLRAELASPPDGRPNEPAVPPFHKDKIERILDRVYDRLVNEASEAVDPRLRELLAEAAARLDAPCPAFREGKIERILDRVQARLADDGQVKKPAYKPAALLGLGSVALFMLRHLSVEVKLLSDKRRPFPDGPAEC